MRLIEGPAAFEADAVQCRAEVRADGPFTRGGSAPASVCLELIAQAAAALLARGDDGPRGGHLLAARSLELFADELRVGDLLDVRARVARSEGLATVDGSVHRGRERVATARLTVLRRGA
ncbi:MAG: hypothetical protein R3A48_18815 [Polyangiales bacterium]